MVHPMISEYQKFAKGSILGSKLGPKKQGANVLFRKMRPRRAKSVPRASQESPKSVPRAPESIPRASESAPRASPERPRVPKIVKNRPKSRKIGENLLKCIRITPNRLQPIKVDKKRAKFCEMPCGGIQRLVRPRNSEHQSQRTLNVWKT